MLSPQARRNIFRIIPFGVIWLLFSLVYTQLEKGLIGDLGYYPATGNPYNFISNLIITPSAALVSGLLIGAIEILYLSKLFTRRSFMEKIIYKSLIYLFIIFIFLLALTALANMAGMHVSIFNAGVWSNVRAFFLSYAFLSVAIYIASIILVSQFYNEVSENMGHAVLTNFFTGRYHRPKEEERIFMFLDMTASTSIAEHLGHVRYFDLLHDYYEDLSDPVIRYLGEIYQYVGDEIVVSWTLERGTRDNNCIRCFFAMQAAIQKQRARYESRYGVVPGFRAGFHLGRVTPCQGTIRRR